MPSTIQALNKTLNLATTYCKNFTHEIYNSFSARLAEGVLGRYVKCAYDEIGADAIVQ